MGSDSRKMPGPCLSYGHVYREVNHAADWSAKSDALVVSREYVGRHGVSKEVRCFVVVEREGIPYLSYK